MPIRETPLPLLNIQAARPISPGGCPSAGDVDMASPTMWASLPDRPRTSESRRPSFSVSNAPDTVPPSAWRIQPGQYVAFTIDTEAAALNYPEGSKEREAVLQFAVGRYIGLVVGSYVQRSEDNSRWLEELVIMFVAPAVPSLVGAERYCMPIAPFHGDVDVMERGPPLRTKTLFPWANRAQWTTFGTRLQVETLHDSQLLFDMDEDEFARFEQRVTSDWEHMDANAALMANEDVKNIVAKLRPPPEPLPAVVWRDIRGKHGEDPSDFVNEVYALDG
ncbi:hypothetical protein C8Q79DRAFT_537155 [Trametes meyenii]|nr:hypothetical protein C8Q79DRAFT_537155 [Trametes meyenii]